jgi:hypothetical protein
LVERLPCKQEVAGSIPAVSTREVMTVYGYSAIWTIVGILLIVLLLIMIF